VRVRKGRNRIVFVFPYLGIVVKIPVMRLWKPLYYSYHDIMRGKWRSLKRDWSAPIEHEVYRGYIFLGILKNWREFWFYLKTKHQFLQPTYFSLFGLFNVQKYGEECRLSADIFWPQFIKITNWQVFEDGHHFSNEKNFCLSKDKLHLVDYGSSKTQKIVLEYGQKFFEQVKLTED